jgi:hypothetical protein
LLAIDQKFIDHFGGNVDFARIVAETDAQLGLDTLNSLFDYYYKLEFKKIIFPNTIAPPKMNDDFPDWATVLNQYFRAEYPCVPFDYIMIFTGELGSGADKGVNRVAFFGTAGNPPYRVAHEIGHVIGMIHPTSQCCAQKPTFMCGYNKIDFSPCETPFFMNNYVFTSNNCSDWADWQPEFSSDHECPPSPGTVQLIINTDNPNPVRGCRPRGDEVVFEVTLINNNQQANRNIRARIGTNNGTKAAFVQDANLDFDCLQSISDGTEFWITEGNDNPNTPECESEKFFSLEPNESKTVRFKVRYTGPDPVQGTDFVVRVYSGTSLTPSIWKDVTIAPFIEINGGLYSTLVSNNQWKSNKPLVLSNNILMNNTIPYDFYYNNKLLFKPGAGMEINAASTVHMTGIEVAGCEAMWKGITVRQGATLTMSEMTSIEDAQFAVNARRGSNFTATNCKFLNNNFAIRTDPSGTGNYNLTLDGNKYGTTTGLKPAYNGQSPAPLDKGFTGIYLENAGAVTIASMFDQPNQFSDLHYGIIAKNTDLTVRSSIFQNIERGVQGSGYDTYVNSFYTGKAIQVSGSSMDVWANSAAPDVTFDNCHTGIQTQNADVNIIGTTMTGVNNGIIANGGFGKAYYIHLNTITASDRGISAFYQSGIPNASTISNNWVTMTGNADGTGIGIGGQDMFPQYEGTVVGNVVTMQAGEAGINIGVANRLKVTQNGVSLAGSDTRYGIKIEGGDRNTLNCNDVTNPGEGNNSGIYAMHPSRTNFLCNTADGPARGLHFEGMLAGKAKANVLKNKMKNNAENGLLLGVDAVIGQQIHAGNKWQGGLTSAQHLSPILANDSKFIADNSENTEFMPDVVAPQSWFLDETTSGETNSQCVPGSDCPLIPAIATDVSLERKIAKSEVGGTTYAAAQQWLAQRRLYETLTEDGNPYQGDTDFNNFLAQAQTSGLSAYANVQIGIRQLGNMSEGDRITAAANLLTTNNSLTGNTAYQVNEKSVNAIFLNTIAVGNLSFTETQIADLRVIANSCPLSDGEAVLRARAMLNLLDEEPVVYKDKDICNPSQPRENRLTAAQSIRLYPNPANDEITVEYRVGNSTDSRLLIFNVYGQLVQEISLPDTNGKVTISAKNMAEGIYWYAVLGTSNPALSGKIIISH